jgi:hydrogenase nickel incorporation protein HypA/HybF
MHELSMAQALVEQVEGIRARENAEAVLSVTVNIGALSGVDRESFEFAFPFAATGTSLAGASLIVKQTPIEVTCTDCGGRTHPDLSHPQCTACGSSSIRITDGRDFIIQSVELRCGDDTPGGASGKGE